MCMFSHTLVDRRVTYPSHQGRINYFIEPDVQCRACYTDLGGAALTENSCIDPGIMTKACRCVAQRLSWALLRPSQASA